jgi:ribosomal protein S18 acetylase RimI-like enzyme
MAEAKVICCPPRQRPAALRRLHGDLPPEQQESLVHALAGFGDADDGAWDTLLVVGQEDLAGVVWVQPAPGNTAVVWPPPASAAATDALLAAAAEAADKRRFGLAQMIVSERDGYSPGRLERCGFPKLAELLYFAAQLPLPRPASSSSVRHPPAIPQFCSFAAREPARLARVVERTYADTQDCPALNGIRSLDDVLAGYRAQGRYLAEHWYFVEDDAGDVGALILADHPSSGNWELVYMGVVPEARGRRYGELIVQFACDCAARTGAERLVLAVDAANEPAIAVYRRAGFFEWDRRTVYAHLAAESLRR